MLKTDVAIIGGGPAGTTVGTLLKKYNPGLDVLILEREKFPRDHVGESHLPAISRILDEMGVWDKVEAAGFPIKIGANFKWGNKDEIWRNDFVPEEIWVDEPRPAKFTGQRKDTAFQVDRSIYDKVLLDHAASVGCRVMEETAVRTVEKDGDRVTGFAISSASGEDQVEARYYVDASGDVGLLRRAMGVEIDAPTALRNIAIWKYYQDAEWAVTIGKGATRIQIMSLGWGWIWFIPITETRTSVGLVLPADYFKSSGLSTEAIFEKAIKEEPLVAKLLSNATAEPEINATKDWNFVSQRLTGDNWLLAGDCCGFADPILSAGMTLAHTSGRKVAYTILELEKGELDPQWVKEQYDDGHRKQIRHHMQFADFWYTSNGHFTDLRDYCIEIAETAGVSLDRETAFRWLASGGFTVEEPGLATALTYRIVGLKGLTAELGGYQPEWEMTKTNRWKLNIDGAIEDVFASYRDGRVKKVPCWRKGNKILPLVDSFIHIINALQRTTDGPTAVVTAVNGIVHHDRLLPKDAGGLVVEGIEALILEGWIDGDVNPDRPMVKV
ncbi:MAG: tryptophan 7-halogenase [Armatimonadetes bacterium]|nr:tryptophan 7-halogenase [Armatimonadota bacterium]